MVSAEETASKRGALIVFEGCDRSGKTSQTLKLLEWMKSRGHSVQLIKFPERTTPLGQMINAYLTNKAELSDEAIHLLFSANRWEKESSMKKTLEEGTSLIVDRYAFSGAAFSAAKGLSLDWCRSPDAGLPKPDRVIFLDLPSESAGERGGFGNERYEKIEFQKKVEATYKHLKDSSWRIIDASKSIEDVHCDITESLSDLLAKELAPVEKLWMELRSKKRASSFSDSNIQTEETPSKKAKE